MQVVEVNSSIVPYTDPDEYYKLRDKTLSDQYKTVQITQEGTVPFTGKYGPNLLDEINRYAIVAEVIAREFSFDLIFERSENSQKYPGLFQVANIFLMILHLLIPVQLRTLN